MKRSVGYTVAFARGRIHLLEPLLLCETRERVRSLLKDYLKHRHVRTPDNVTFQIIECPATMALACLTKKNNVLADRVAQTLLRQSLRSVKQLLTAKQAIDFKAAPSAMPGIHLINVPVGDRTRLKIILPLLLHAYPDAWAGFSPDPRQ